MGWISTHETVRDEIAALGGEIVGEARLAPDGTDVPRTVRRVCASKADLIINSTVGDLTGVGAAIGRSRVQRRA